MYPHASLEKKQKLLAEHMLPLDHVKISSAVIVRSLPIICWEFAYIMVIMRPDAVSLWGFDHSKHKGQTWKANSLAWLQVLENTLRSLCLLCRCPGNCRLQPTAISFYWAVFWSETYTGFKLQVTKQVSCSHVTFYVDEMLHRYAVLQLGLCVNKCLFFLTIQSL